MILQLFKQWVYKIKKQIRQSNRQGLDAWTKRWHKAVDKCWSILLKQKCSHSSYLRFKKHHDKLLALFDDKYRLNTKQYGRYNKDITR